MIEIDFDSILAEVFSAFLPTPNIFEIEIC